jgi:hypothetical protein
MSTGLNQESGIPRYKDMNFNLLRSIRRSGQTVIESVSVNFGISDSDSANKINKLNKYKYLFDGMMVAIGWTLLLPDVFRTTFIWRRTPMDGFRKSAACDLIQIFDHAGRCVAATGTLIDDEGFQMISIETYRLLED